MSDALWLDLVSAARDNAAYLRSLSEPNPDADELDALCDALEASARERDAAVAAERKRWAANLTAVEGEYDDQIEMLHKMYQAEIARMREALEGAKNWLSALLVLIEETSCSPDDEDAFDEVVLAATMALGQAGRALKEGESK